MRKGVANLFRSHEVSRQANHRYLDALAVVDDPSRAMLGLDGVPTRKEKLSIITPQRAPFAQECPGGIEHLDVIAAGIANKHVAGRVDGYARRSVKLALAAAL